jgi:VWFA-related protein
MSKLSVSSLALILVLTLAAVAQQTQPAKPVMVEDDAGQIISVDVDIVTLYCAVRNRQNGLINSLTKDDFDLREDGAKQTIKYFSKETNIPLTLGLLVDVSNSQGNLIEIERQAAASFFRHVLKQKDVAFLLSFGADAELLQDVTGSPRILEDGLRRLKLNGGFSGINSGPVPTMGQPRGTVLYDAVYLAAGDMLAKEAGRKAMILITDGEDQGSRETEKQAIEAALKADAIIYGILYVDRRFYAGNGIGMGVGYSGASVLKHMAEDTGGHMFEVRGKDTLESIFQQIQDEMRTQYLIGYTPTNSKKDGGYRKIDLRTQVKDQKVQVRKGYYAMPPQ